MMLHNLWHVLQHDFSPAVLSQVFFKTGIGVLGVATAHVTNSLGADSTLSLGEVLGVGGVVIAFVYYGARKYQALLDEVTAMHNKLDNLYCMQQKRCAAENKRLEDDALRAPVLPAKPGGSTSP